MFLSSGKVDPDDTFICLAPGGGASFGSSAYRKNWPLNNFSRLSKKLQDDPKVKLAVLLGPNEQELGKAFQETERLQVVSPLSIIRAAAVINRCRLFVSNDSGLLRIANALDKKIVTIFGPVDEKTYSPYPVDKKRQIVVKKDLPCRPCYKKFRLPECQRGLECLKSITVEEVCEAISRLL